MDSYFTDCVAAPRAPVCLSEPPCPPVQSVQWGRGPETSATHGLPQGGAQHNGLQMVAKALSLVGASLWEAEWRYRGSKKTERGGQKGGGARQDQDAA